jgi:hypothetical protein
MAKTIEDIVRKYVNFKNISSSGWNSTYCEHCGDGARTKGPRGGWLFEGEMAFYNCFNAGCEGSFDPNRDVPLSSDMWGIMKSFGIPYNEVMALVRSDKPKHEVKKRKAEFQFLDLPDHMHELNDPMDHPLKRAALDHLIEKRRINPLHFNFYLSSGETKSSDPREIKLAHAFKNRLIIPSYVNDKLIGYEGMLLKGSGLKYLSVGKNLIHGYPNMFHKNPETPLFVTEGFFDAYHLNGVAVLTNKITNAQIEILNRTNRPKVIVPDRKNDSHMLAERALELGWGLSLPNIKPYKDISEAIENYGILNVVESTVKNIKYGKFAELYLGIYNFR